MGFGNVTKLMIGGRCAFAFVCMWSGDEVLYHVVGKLSLKCLTPYLSRFYSRILTKCGHMNRFLQLPHRAVILLLSMVYSALSSTKYLGYSFFLTVYNVQQRCVGR